MKQSKLIAELKALDGRRVELAAEVEAAGAAHAAAQDGLLKGTAQTSDVTAAHSNLIALASALSALDAKIGEARRETEQEAEREAARVKDSRRAEIRAEYERLVTDYRAAWLQLDEALKQGVTHLIEMQGRWAELVREEERLDEVKNTGALPLDFVAVRAHQLSVEFGPQISAALLARGHSIQREQRTAMPSRAA